MRKLALTAALIAVLAALGSAQGALPDFSGTWNADLAKSDFGPTPPPVSMVLVIVHKEPNIKVTSTQKTADGIVTNVRNLTTDGKENLNKVSTGDGDQDVKSTSTWIGKKLLTASAIETQGVIIQLNDTWELSDGGKVLTIVREFKTPDAAFTAKVVYNKQ